MSSPFSVVSLFAGCGGSSLGYGMAGGNVRLAVEWNDHAVETYRANFPETPVYHGDVAKLTIDECCSLTNIEPGELDILDGSPPCQGFSMAGKRDFEDARNSLFLEYLRILEGLRPKVLVMENVSGLVKGKMKLIFVEILKGLKAAGYRVSCRLMNAKYYGVPQDRQRLIFIGVRDDLDLGPSHPKPSHQIVTAGEALRDVRNTEDDLNAVPRLSELYAAQWPFIPVGSSSIAMNSSLGKPLRANREDCVKLDPDRPARTLKSLNPGSGFATVVHWSEKRSLTIPEAKRLQSFPDDFRLTGKYIEQWARIGNSVPPLLTKAIARHINQSILQPLSTVSIEV